MDVNLIPLTKDDLELVRSWRTSKEVSHYMYTEPTITPEQQLEWYNRISKDESSRYWIIEYNGNKLGLASITNIDRNLESCFWAFYLGDTSVRGAGIGAKVELKVLSFVFENLGLNKLRCEVFSFNEKVIKMHEKFGFRREAYYREHCTKDNEKQDVVGLAILKQDWLKIKDSLNQKIYGN